MSLSDRCSVHLVGAAGAGIAPLGVLLAQMGHHVSGSDLRNDSNVLRLEACGAVVHIGHDPAHVAHADVVAHSTAVPEHNVELCAARRAGIPVLCRADLLRLLCDRKQTLAVAGTHGKTTTSSMLALCLVAAGQQPSFLVGGAAADIGGGAVWDRDGRLFVVEADESDGTFLELGAAAGIVTSIEADHLDRYGDLAALTDAFERFVDSLSGPRVLCADDPGAAALAARMPDCVTYGMSAEASYRITDAQTDRSGSRFGLEGRGIWLGRCRLPLTGRHNVLNAAGALAAALELDAPLAPMLEALSRFAGVSRRYEYRGTVDGVTYIDDYAHLPTEVAATIAAARAGGWQRIVAVYQPHRYTRTAAVWQEYADAFVEADLVVITEVYPAGEPPLPGIGAELVLRAVLDAHPRTAAAFMPSLDDAASYLAGVLRPGDLCLTMGAGDLTGLPDRLLGSSLPLSSVRSPHVQRSAAST